MSLTHPTAAVLCLTSQKKKQRFVANLDPNGPPASNTLLAWPQYTLSEKKTLVLQDSAPQLSVGTDEYRIPQMELIQQLALKYPL